MSELSTPICSEVSEDDAPPKTCLIVSEPKPQKYWGAGWKKPVIHYYNPITGKLQK